MGRPLVTISLTVTTARARAAHLGPDRRRPQVLDTALQIAAEQGLSGVTMGALAAGMGVSRPVVYACFADRAEVLAALLERERDLALQNLFAMLPPERTGSIEQMFVDGFAALLTAVGQRRLSWSLMYADDPDPAVAPAVRLGRAQVRDRITEVMYPLLERWQVGDPDLVNPLLSDVFLAICETAVMTFLTDATRATPAQQADVFGRAAYRALRAVPPPPTADVPESGVSE